MTKNEEIKLIQEFYSSLPNDSYLKDILKGVPEDCEEQLRNDFAMDYIGTIQHLEEKNSNLLNDNQRLCSEKKELEDRLLSKIDEIDNTTLNYKEQLKSNDEEIEHLANELLKEQRKVRDLELTIATRCSEIIELKARLYDLLIKESK